VASMWSIPPQISAGKCPSFSMENKPATISFPFTS
jgi:hypothetical protein